MLGIEPGTNYPNPRTFEKQHGRVVELNPGEAWRGEVTVAWHAESPMIARQEAAIRAIQQDRKGETLAHPRADWSK